MTVIIRTLLLWTRSFKVHDVSLSVWEPCYFSVKSGGLWIASGWTGFTQTPKHLVGLHKQALKLHTHAAKHNAYSLAHSHSINNERFVFNVFTTELWWNCPGMKNILSCLWIIVCSRIYSWIFIDVIYRSSHRGRHVSINNYTKPINTPSP